MVKKVFAIIGIVLGSVAAFVGAVFGVMAAMGKFKTPVVYPTQLEFLNNDQVVIERVAFDTERDWDKQGEGVQPNIYTLTLKGSNSKEKHSVNKQKCYLWFEGNVGSNLITLCDENGKPLEKNEKNYYTVKCNEPIHYMINKVDYSTLQDGKVMLKARSVNERCETLTPLTLWIDRQVEKITLNAGDLASDVQGFEQQVHAGVGIPLEFKYNTQTEYSLKPISKESEKEIELFYTAKGYSTDYLKVTPEEVANQASPLHNFFEYDEENNVLTFEAKKAGTYIFYLGAFKTYESKQKYEDSIVNETIQNPNYHKVNYKINNESAMAITKVTILVKNIEIGDVAMTGVGVVQNLYSKTDYISLNGVSGVVGAKDNNLQLTMKKYVGNETAIDSSRFVEAEFGNVEFANSTEDIESLPVFESVDLENTVTAKCDNKGEKVAATVDNKKVECKNQLSKITILDDLSNEYTIVEYVSYSTTDKDANPIEVKLYCSNGMAAYNNNLGYKLIRTGTYLNYFVKDEEGKLTQTTNDQFQYEATKVEDSNSWNVISKNIPNLEDEESLVLGVLVVNSFGESRTEKLFESIPVSVNPMPFESEIKKSEITLNITFGNDLNKDGKYEKAEIQTTNYDGIDFEDIVSITGGSYNVGLLFVEEKQSKFIKTIDKINFEKDETKYVLVGYVETTTNQETGETTNKFVNRVELNGNLDSQNNTCELVLVQLKNGYDQTIDDIITSEVLSEINSKDEPEEEPPAQATAISEELFVMINNQELCQIEDIYGLDESIITINGKYIVNKDLLSFAFENKVEAEIPSYYENGEGHVLTITSEHNSMIRCIKNFFTLSKESVSSNYQDNIEITNIEQSEEKIKITFNTKNCLSDNNIPISWSIDFAEDQIIELPEFKILSSSPTQIVYRYQDKGAIKSIKLSKTPNVENNTDYFEVKMVETYPNFYVHTNSSDETYVNFFGSWRGIISENGLGFQDEVFKGEEHEVHMESLNTEIIRLSDVKDGKEYRCSYRVVSVGTACLAITIGDTTQYLKLVVTAEGLKFTTLNNQTTFTRKLSTNDKEVRLYDPKGTNYVIYTYEEKELVPNTRKEVYVENIKCVYYGDGDLRTQYKSIDTWFGVELIKKNPEGGDTTPVLTIKEDEKYGYVFTKNEPYVTLTIQFDLRTIIGTKTLTFTFGSDVSVGINDAWKDKILYAGTTIQLTGEHALFNAEKGISFKGAGIKENYLDLTDVDPTTDHEIKAMLEGKVVYTFSFVVKPNVIATLKDEELTTDTEYTISDLYDLKKYPVEEDDENTTIYYGSSESCLYNKVKPVGLNNTDMEKLRVVVDKSTYKTLKFNTTTEINGKQEKTLQLKYQGPGAQTFTIETTNGKNTVTINNALTANIEQCKIKALNEYNISDFVEIFYYYEVDKYVDISESEYSDYKLSSIKDNSTSNPVKFDVTETSFIITSVVTKEAKVPLTLTYSATGKQNLTLDCEVTIIPYSPEANVDLPVFAGETFNIKNDVYGNNSSFEGQIGNIDYTISFVGIADENKELIQGAWSATEEENEIKINSINSDDKGWHLVYEFRHKDGSYYYYEDITITNPQKINIQYPESDDYLKIESSTNITFLAGYESDAREIAGTDKNTNNTYIVDKIGNYEPILINVNEDYELNFLHDIYKNMNHVQITTDDRFNGLNEYDSDVRISLIGYGNTPGMRPYVDKILNSNPKEMKNSVTLPKASNLNNVLVFKLTTDSGNTKYYYVKICTKPTASIRNNMEVVLHNGQDLFSGYGTGNNRVAHVGVTENMTYKALVQQLVQQLKENFSNNFGGMSYGDDTKLYIYDTDDETITKYKCATNQNVNLTNNFNTITLGLLYEKGVEVYTYGTITIYAQPANGLTFTYDLLTQDETDKNPGKPNLLYELPIGKFTSKIEASANNVPNPVDDITVDKTIVAGASAEFIKTDELPAGYQVVGNAIIYFSGDAKKALSNETGYEYKSVVKGNTKYVVKAEYNETGKIEEDLEKEAYFYVTYSDSKFEDVQSVEGSCKLIDICDDGDLAIFKRISEDLTFNVKYTTKDGATLKDSATFEVEYTYGKTALTNQSIININPITVGEFKSTFNENNEITSAKFNNTININATDATVTKPSTKTYSEFFHGSYSGTIKFTIKTNGQTYSKNGDEEFTSDKNFSCDAGVSYKEGVFTFDQGTAEKNVEIVFKYVDFNAGANERTYTFVVKAGIAFDFGLNEDGTSNEKGTESGNRQETTPTNNNYNSKVGSQISVYYDDTFSSTHVYSYTIGGRVIYTNSQSVLELSFGEDYRYVVDGGKVLTSNRLPIDESMYDNNIYNIDFVHTILPKDLTITIKIKKGTHNTGAFYVGEVAFYATVSSTYSGLKSVYYVNGADHENVIKGNVSDDLHTYLFATKTEQEGKTRVVLLDTSGNEVKSSVDVPVDLLEMGLNDPNNPNFIEFEMSALHGTITKNETNTKSGSSTETNKYNLTINELTENTVSALTMKNFTVNNGSANNRYQVAVYNFQIMAGTQADKLIYVEDGNNDAPYHVFGNKSVSEGTTNLAFTVQKLYDKDGKATANDTGKLYVIGKLFDTNNTFKFDLQNKPVVFPCFAFPEDLNNSVSIGKAIYLAGGNTTYKMEDDGTITKDSAIEFEQFIFLNDKNENENKYTNAVQYEINGNYVLTIDLDTGYIELRIKSKDPIITDVEEFKLTLTGVNGNNAAILNNLNIVMSGVDYKSNYENLADTNVYGGDEIDILTKLALAEGEKIDAGYKIEMVKDDITKSYFEYNGKTQQISELCFTKEKPIDGATKYYLVVGNPAQTISNVCTTFQVTKDDVVIDEFVYKFNVNRNMQFVVNGAGLNEYTKNSHSASTNFHLNRFAGVETTTHTGGNFPVTVNLKYAQTADADHKKELANAEYCYDVLYYSLFWLNKTGMYDDGQIIIEEVSIFDSSTNAELVAPEGGTPAVEVNVKDKKITFNKDFNGQIKLLLKAGTALSDTYSFEWEINVTGIRTPVVKVTSNEKLMQSTEYASDESVFPISANEDDKGIAVLWGNTNNKFDYGVKQTTASVKDDVVYNYTYTYHVFEYDSTKLRDVNNKDLFDGYNDKYKQYHKGSKTMTGGKLSGSQAVISLPAVPLTMSNKSYVVVYKMTMDYLSSGYYTYYFAYLVINEGKIQTHSAIVDMDNGLTVIIPEGGGVASHYLEIFGYKQFGTGTDNKRYELIYSKEDDEEKPSIKLLVGESNSGKTGFNGDYETYKLGDDKKTFTLPTAPQDSNKYIVKTDGSTTELYLNDENIPQNKKCELTAKGHHDDTNIHSLFESTFLNIFAYKSFIDDFYGKTYNKVINTADASDETAETSGIVLQDDTSDASEETKRETSGIVLQDNTSKIPVELTHIADGRFGINLSDYFNNVKGQIKNELICDVVLYQEGVEIYKVNRYNALSSEDGFKLTTENKITANTNGGRGYASSEIFPLSSYYNFVNIEDYKKLQDLPIVGVGTPDTKWFAKASSIMKDKDGNIVTAKVCTITIPGNVIINTETIENVTYKIYEATAMGESSTNPLYVLEHTFNYISDESNVVVPAYTKVSTETSYFRQNYNPSYEHVSLKLTNAFLNWFMDTTTANYTLTNSEEYLEKNSELPSNKKIKVDVTGKTKPSKIFVGDEANSNEWDKNIFFEDDSIKINIGALQEYKRLNPTATTYKKITLNIAVTIGESTTGTDGGATDPEGGATVASTSSGKTFKCDVVFVLDDFVQVDIGYDYIQGLDEELDKADINEYLYDQDENSKEYYSKFAIPTVNGGFAKVNKKDEKIHNFTLPTEHDVDVKTLNSYADGANYLTEDVNGYKLNITALNKHFKDDDDEIKILLKLTTTDGKTMIIKLVITKATTTT